MPSKDFVRAGTAFAVPGHEFPPGVRSPGKINQRETLFFGRVWILDRRCDEPVPLTAFMRFEKAHDLFHALILTTGEELHHREETEELCTMIFVEGPEKLLIVIAHVGQVFFTRLQDLALLAANDRIHRRQALIS